MKIKDKLAGNTALIITHRPEILKICDEVISFGNGEQLHNIANSDILS